MNKTLLIVKILFIFLFGKAGYAHSIYSDCQYYLDTCEHTDSLFIYLSQLSKLSLVDEGTKQLFLSRYYRNKSNIDSQLKHLYKAKEICQESCPDTLRSYVLDDLALTLCDGGILDRKKALEYINQSLSLKKATGQHEQLALGYFIKSSVLYYAHQFEKEELGSSEIIDSAIYYLKLSNEISTNKTFKINASNNLAAFLIEKKEYEKAKSILNTVLEYYHQEKDYYSVGYINNLLADIRIGQNNLDQADSILIENIESNLKRGNYPIVETAYIYRIKIADQKKDYKKGTELRDSLKFIIEEYNDIKNYEAQEKYNSAALEVQLINEEAEKLKTRARYGGLSILLFLLTISGLVAYRIQKIKKQGIENELEKTKIQGSLNAARAQLEGEQKEREAIATKLHNELASSLSACQMHIKLLKRDDLIQDNPSLSIIAKLISTVNTQVRDISHQLVSPLLIKYGLDSAIQNAINELEGSKTKISYTSNLESMRLLRTKEVFIYQSVLECLQNSLKHADPNWVSIRLIIDSSKLRLVIENDIIQKPKSTPSGLGLITISEKANAFGGEFKFQIIENRAISELILPVDTIAS